MSLDLPIQEEAPSVGRAEAVAAIRALADLIEQRTDLPVPETIIAQHSIVEPDPANEVTVRVAAKALGVTALISPEDSAICSYEVARRPLSATYQIAAALPAVNTVNQPGGLR